MSGQSSLEYDEFIKHVDTYGPDVTFLAYFMSPTCRPCAETAPIVDKIYAKYNNVKLVKFHAPKVPHLAGAFKVTRVPHLVIIKEGLILSYKGAEAIKNIEEELLNKGLLRE